VRGAAASWFAVGLTAVAAAAQGERADAAPTPALLSQLQDEGRLDVATALRAFATATGTDDDAARTVAAIVRHEWADVPSDLLRGLDGDPAGARALLRELARAPRPSLRPWAHAWSLPAPGRTRDDRCLALAARGEPLATEDAVLVFEALLEAPPGEGFFAALTVLPPKLADGLLGRVHQALLDQRLSPEAIVPLLDRMSPRGLEAALGLVAALPPEAGAGLLRYLEPSVPGAVQQRVERMLEQARLGTGPLELPWLAHATPALRAGRDPAPVQALLGDAAADYELRRIAFLVLVDAGLVDDTVLAFTVGDDGTTYDRGQRIRHVLDRAIDDLPAALLIRWLGGDEDLSERTVRALARRSRLGAELEAHLVALLRDAKTAAGPFLSSAAQALAHAAGPEAFSAVFALVVDAGFADELLKVLARRPEPEVGDWLAARLAAGADPAGKPLPDRVLDDVALALAVRGDRRGEARLVANAPRQTTTFVRRCATALPGLSAEHALALLEAVPSVGDALAAELVGWAGSALAHERVRQRFVRMWADGELRAEPTEAFEAAMRALVASPARPAVVDEVRRQLARGPLPDVLASAAFELVGAMPAPPTEHDLTFAAELLLLQPRSDPEHEAELARRWPDGGYGFPLVGAIAERLRAADPTAAGAVFAAAAQQALDDPRHTAISRQRLVVLWRTLSVVPLVQQAVGAATAPLLLRLPPTEGRMLGDAPARLFLARSAAARVDHDAAERHARAAIAGFLRLPDDLKLARLFLGERDPGAGVDPFAALAAEPHRHAHARATANGDAAAAAAAAALVREFAGHDRRTHASLSTDKEPPR
jgi:hypothetical protein